MDAGVDARVGMAPILPGLGPTRTTRAVVRAAREAGATGIWANLLFLKPGTREHFLESLAREWPDELPRYEVRTRDGRAYLPKEKRSPYARRWRGCAREHGIRDRRPVRLAPPPEPEQLALTL